MSNIKIAMWSGPRNISTAMMRAWENRRDCLVWDEPLYGYYLKTTGLEHPGAKEVIADQGSDWRKITSECILDIPQQKPIFYQKHMTAHLLPEMDRQWLNSLTNCFLIRQPAAVIASYSAVREEPTLDDLGFRQQAELFDYVAQTTGKLPLVIDSKEFLKKPEAMLRAICQKLDIEYDGAMLSWPLGPRDSDGVWARHWYASVCQSTGFTPFIDKAISLTGAQNRLAEQAFPFYQKLFQQRLTA